MRIAGSIVLGVIGAILYFAVTVDVSGVSLPTVGIILMVAAGVWFLVELVGGLTGRSSGLSSTSRTGTTSQTTGARDVTSTSGR